MYEAGDVLIWPGWPGHVGMVFYGDETRPRCIHASNKVGFRLGYIRISADIAVYRPPWDLL